MTNKVTLKNSGLFTNINSLGDVPQGAMLVADNIVIDKNDIVEIRRGFKLFGDSFGDSSDQTLNQLINYKNRILRHFQISSGEGYLQYQNDPGGETFSDYLKRKFLFASSLTTTGSTASFITDVPHGIIEGDSVVIENASVTGYNGTFTVSSVPSITEFNYIVGSSLASATGAYLLESTYNDVLQTDDDIKIKSVEANQNLYFTTSEGIKKIDTYNATVIDSGVSKALDISAELYDSPGFFIEEGQVGYRVVWGYKDVNDNLLLGAASSRAFIANDGSQLFITDFNNVLNQLDANTNLSENDYYADLNLDSNATLSEINNEVVNLAAKLDTDTGPTDSDYEAGLPVTGGTTIQEAQENFDYIVDKLNNDPGVGESDFENARTSQQVRLTITIPKGITQNYFYQIYRTSESIALDVTPNEDYQLVYEANPTIDQISQGYLTVVDITPDAFRGAALYQNPGQEGDDQANEQPPFARDIALYNNIVFYANTKTRHNLSFDLVGLDPLSEGVTGSSLIFDNGTETFTLTFSSSGEDIANCIALLDQDSEKTVAQRVDSTARSMVRVINRCDDNGFLNAYYISTPDGIPGKMLLEASNISDPQFNIQAFNSTIDVDGNTVSAYSPALINKEYSTNEVKPNRIYYSKTQEPEAVPSLNFLPVGGGDNFIYRIASLRDGLFIFSDEGVFRIVGDTTDTLVLAQFDNTTKIVSSESLAKGNNQIFVMTDEGVCTVSDTGTDIISRYIEDKLLNLLDPEYTNFTVATFGYFYPTDRKYVLFTVTNKSDEFATQAFVYNVFTTSWVRWPISKTCALVNSYDQKLYFGPSDMNSLEQERKNFSYTDHADREHTRNIIKVSTIITSIGLGNPSIVEAFQHGLSDNDLISIEGTDSTPNIDGEHRVTILDENNFLINGIDVTIAGTEGRWQPIETQETVYVTLNVDTTNDIDVGDVILQERTSTVNDTTYDYTVESIVVSIDENHNNIQMYNLTPFIAGECIVYDYIPVEVQWVPIHAGDPALAKQFSEIHLLFDQFRGTDVKILVSSDIQKSKELVDFDLTDIGNWGQFPWGGQPWGGEPLSKQVRTYVPQGKQRCQLLNVTFKHEAAREQWRLEGLSVVFRAIKVGSRTNR